MFVYIVVRGEQSSLVKAFPSRKEAEDWCRRCDYCLLEDPIELSEDNHYAIVRMIVGEMSVKDYLSNPDQLIEA